MFRYKIRIHSPNVALGDGKEVQLTAIFHTFAVHIELIIMIIYNITQNIDKTVHSEWLVWIKEHIPQVLATGKFIDAKLTKVLVEDSETDTYSVQFKAHSRASLDAFYADHAEKLNQEGFERFGDKVLSFKTELEVVDEYAVTIK